MEIALSPRVETRLAKLAISHGLPPPTALERRLYRALERLNIRYLPEMPFAPYRVDCYLPAWGIALEADGDAVHQCRQCGFEEYAAYHERKRAYRDRRLLTQHHVLCLHIWEHDGWTDEQMYRSVVRALRPYCQSAPWAQELEREA